MLNRKKDINNIILVIFYKKRKIIVERTDNWEINMTQLAKFFGKQWKSWLRRNRETVNELEILAGKRLTRLVGARNRRQTLVEFKLALRVLDKYDLGFSQLLQSKYNESSKTESLTCLKKKIELLNAEIALLKNQAVEVFLTGGPNLFYAYGCNGGVKFGTSYLNKNGARPKFHKGSVPNFSIGFVIYSEKRYLQLLNTAIKTKFRIVGNNERINCTLLEMQNFVTQYLKLMDFDFKKEDGHLIDLLNIFLRK